jgi:hypothetical protein
MIKTGPSPYARLADFDYQAPVMIVSPSGCRMENVEDVTDDSIILRNGLRFDALHKTALLDSGEYAVLVPHSSAVFLKLARGTNLTGATIRLDRATDRLIDDPSVDNTLAFIQFYDEWARLRDRFEERI